MHEFEEVVETVILTSWYGACILYQPLGVHPHTTVALTPAGAN